MLHGTFYAFSGTNLLTRCRSASSCFLLFLVSEKLHRKYSRNWAIRRQKFLYFTVPKQLTWRESKKGCRAATLGLGAASPWPAPRVCAGPPGLLRLRLF